MTSMHEPTPEFERYLEWQVTTALRRQDRFARPSAFAAVAATAGFRSSLRALAVVAVSISLGAGVVMASGRLQDNHEKQLLTVQQQGEIQLAEVQAELARKNLDQTKQRAEIGVAPIDDVAAAERAVQAAQLNIQRVRLNIIEVQMSGRPVQDDVTSPLVNGRDFVLERLDLDRSLAAAAANEAKKRLLAMQSRYDVGLVQQVQVAEARAELVRCETDMKTIEDKIALRKKFISGGLSPTDATRQRLIITTQYELRYAQAALDLATQRSDQIDRMKQLGTTGEVEALKARLELLSRQQDLERLRERLTLLQKGGPLPDGARDR